MAKFRQGHLVLTSTQQIIQGTDIILDEDGAASVSSLKINETGVVSEISNDSTTSSSASLLTASAIHELNIAGTSGTSGSSGSSGTSGLGNLGAGVDNRIARYDGANAIQDTGIAISDTQDVTGQKSLTLVSAGLMQAGTSPSGVADMEYNGYFHATKVYGAVWG